MRRFFPAFAVPFVEKADHEKKQGIAWEVPPLFQGLSFGR